MSLEVKDAQRLLKHLDMMFFPLRYKALPASQISWLCGELLGILDKFSQQALVTNAHIAFFRYHEKHPDAVVLCSNPVDKAAYEAAQRALMIHIDRLKKASVAKR